MDDLVPRPRNGLSLCAGGGGLDMGLMLAEPGFHTRCFVEWEEYPRTVLIAAQRAGYFAPAPIWDDLTTFDARPFAGCFDSLLAGYPCQPFSHAGQRRGEDDERHLWPHVARVAAELGDSLRWVFLENVAGHVTLGLEAVLRELWSLGFAPAAGLFTAAETGASHERQRLFIVAYRQGADGRGEQPAGTARGGRAGPAGTRAGLADTSRARRQPEGAGAGEERGGGQSVSGARVGDLADGDGQGRGRVAVLCAGWGDADPIERGADTNRCLWPLGDPGPDADAGRPEGRGDRGGPGEGKGQGSERQRLWDRPRGAGDDVGHAASVGCREGQPEPGLRSGGATAARAGGELADPDDGRGEGRQATEPAQPDPHGAGGRLADTGGAGLPHPERGEPGSAGWGHQGGATAERGRPRLHPPGPSDMAGWLDVLSQSPWLAPAASFGDLARLTDQAAAMAQAGVVEEAEAEPALRRMADGLAARARALRLLGNGVHPLEAGYAWRTLAAAHGLGPLDLATAADGGGADAG